jgi:ketosteroid isomerase-like protein
MLKKILLPLLMAAVVLPQSVSAAIAPNGTSQARGMIAVKNSLSANEQQAIKKSLIAMVKASNSGDVKAIMAHYSRQYAATVNDQASDYNEMKANIRVGAAFMKAYGLKLAIKEIKVTNTDRSQPQVTIDYKIVADAEAAAEMSEKERQSLKRLKGKMRYTLTSEKGRWLIIAIEPLERFTASVANQPTTPTASAPAKNQQQERKTLQALFKKHIQALNKEDLQAYLATLDPKSAQYKEAQTQTQKLFKEYDLKYEVETIEVISIGQQNAVVKMVATVKKIKGGSFADSKIIAYNTLRKTSQGWRIADTQIESVSALASR